MDCLIFNLYQYFFGKNQQNSEFEDHSNDYLNNTMKEEEWNSISTSTIKSTNNSKHSIENIEDRSKLPNTTPIKDQIVQCTELYQCLKNAVKELGEQKLMLDTQFKGLTLNLNNNNIRLIAVEKNVKNLVLKCMGLSHMYETLQDQLEMVSEKINVKFDYLEQILSYHIAERYKTRRDTSEDL